MKKTVKDVLKGILLLWIAVSIYLLVHKVGYGEVTSFIIEVPLMTLAWMICDIFEVLVVKSKEEQKKENETVIKNL